MRNEIRKREKIFNLEMKHEQAAPSGTWDAFLPEQVTSETSPSGLQGICSKERNTEIFSGFYCAE